MDRSNDSLGGSYGNCWRGGGLCTRGCGWSERLGVLTRSAGACKRLGVLVVARRSERLGLVVVVRRFARSRCCYGQLERQHRVASAWRQEREADRLERIKVVEASASLEGLERLVASDLRSLAIERAYDHVARRTLRERDDLGGCGRAAAAAVGDSGSSGSGGGGRCRSLQQRSRGARYRCRAGNDTLGGRRRGGRRRNSSGSRRRGSGRRRRGSGRRRRGSGRRRRGSGGRCNSSGRRCRSSGGRRRGSGGRCNSSGRRRNSSGRRRRGSGSSGRASH